MWHGVGGTLIGRCREEYRAHNSVESTSRAQCQHRRNRTMPLLRTSIRKESSTPVFHFLKTCQSAAAVPSVCAFTCVSVRATHVGPQCRAVEWGFGAAAVYLVHLDVAQACDGLEQVVRLAYQLHVTVPAQATPRLQLLGTQVPRPRVSVPCTYERCASPTNGRGRASNSGADEDAALCWDTAAPECCAIYP